MSIRVIGLRVGVPTGGATGITGHLLIWPHDLENNLEALTSLYSLGFPSPSMPVECIEQVHTMLLNVRAHAVIKFAHGLVNMSIYQIQLIVPIHLIYKSYSTFISWLTA